MRVLDRLLLGIAGLSLFLMLFIFFNDDSHLAAKSLTAQKATAPERTLPVSLNNTAYAGDMELKSADVDVALERYFDEIRKKPELGEEDLRLVDELVPDEGESARLAENAPAAAEPQPPRKGRTDAIHGDGQIGDLPTGDPTTGRVSHKKGERVLITKHKVAPGESIWRIAKRYGVSVHTVVSANRLKEKTTILPGDTLRVPDRAGIFYKPKKRENLTEIARKFKINGETVRKANGLDDKVVAGGTEIFLPGAKPLPEIQYIRQKVFAWPIKADHRLTSGFGWRVHPITGNKAFHTGLDIGAKMRTPIYAAADGVVAYSGDGGSYGNMVILRHKNGLFTVYGHASKLIARKGKYVKRGQKIALVGSTGASTGAHLHFEVKSPEKHVNPNIALKKTERVAIKRKDA